LTIKSIQDPEMRRGHKSASHAFEGFRAAVAVDPDTQLITAAATLENAVQALNNGAFSYLTKPFDHLSVFDSSVSRALEFRRLALDNQRMAEIQKRRGDLLEAEVGDRIQQLRKSQRELLDLLALLPEGVLVLSAEGKIVLTNPSAERWLAREYQTKDRPIQNYIQQLVQGKARAIEMISLHGHTLSLTALELPAQEDKRRLAMLIRDETEVEATSPNLQELARQMRAPLAGLYRQHHEGPMARLVMELAILVSRIESQAGAAPPSSGSPPRRPPESVGVARPSPASSSSRPGGLPSDITRSQPVSSAVGSRDMAVRPGTVPPSAKDEHGGSQSAPPGGPSSMPKQVRKRVTAMGSDLLRGEAELENSDEDTFDSFHR
jgi:PAS domain-containing protein